MSSVPDVYSTEYLPSWMSALSTKVFLSFCPDFALSTKVFLSFCPDLAMGMGKRAVPLSEQRERLVRSQI